MTRSPWARIAALAIFVCSLLSIACIPRVPNIKEPVGTSQLALTGTLLFRGSISDDNAGTSAQCQQTGNQTWCDCGTVYSDPGSNCTSPGDTFLFEWATPGCQVQSNARFKTSESVSTWLNATAQGGTENVVTSVRRLLPAFVRPQSGQAGYCAPSSVANWHGPGGGALWAAPGAKGDGTDRTTVAAPRVDAAGNVLSDTIAMHDTPALAEWNVTNLLNGCPSTGSCVIAVYVSSGKHLALTGTPQLEYNCVQGVCNNGVVEGNEQCDDGNPDNSDGCLASCVPASCGDGFVRTTAPTEACDDGNTFNTDGCVQGCVVASCGDGFVRAGVEQCDDGNTASHDGCSSSCTTETCTWSMNGLDPSTPCVMAFQPALVAPHRAERLF